MHNHIVSPFTILVEVTRDRKGVGLDLPALKIPLALIDISKKENKANVKQAIEINYLKQATTNVEMYYRRMLSRCAIKVNIPYSSNSEWPNSREIRSLLAPTTKKLIRFVDKSDHYWETATAYLKPITNTLGEENVRRLAWKLYLLILAAKYKSEVILSPEKTLALIHEIESSTNLNAEGRARLAVVAGLFRCFSIPVEGPCLRFLPNVPSHAVSERIAEIMEDAYLLEASHLRRLFGIQQNIASVKRDLRLLLSFIRKERSWAKGLITTGSNLVFGGTASLAALEKLIKVIPELEKGAHYPVLAVNDENIVVKHESYWQFNKGITNKLLLSIDASGLPKRKPNNSFNRTRR